MSSISSADSSQVTLGELRADIGRLDKALASAVGEAQRAFGAGNDDRRFAGLVIAHDEPERLLSRPLGAAAFGPDRGPGMLSWRSRRLTKAAQTCVLSDFDTAVVLLAAAPEIDLRYERIYAYLQDDVTRRRPTISLALDLFAPDATGKLALRSRFLPDAPLRRHGLVELVADSQPAPPPLLAHGLRPADGVVRFLLGEPALDDALTLCCRLETVANNSDQRPPLTEEIRQRLIALGTGTNPAEHGPVVLVAGGDHVERRAVASALAVAGRRPLLSVDLGALAGREPQAVVTAARRAAVLHDAVINVLGGDWNPDAGDLAGLLDGTVPAVADMALARSIGHHDRRSVHLAIPRPDFARRRALYEAALGPAVKAPGVSASIAESLARRFRLSPEAIEEVIGAAAGTARWRSAVPDDTAEPTFDDFMGAAREATRGHLDGLARRITPRRDRSALILPPDRFALLDAIRVHVDYAPIVADEWGFADTMSEGIVALFAGPPGTGKTLAAEVLAGELGLDLYAIDLSQVVSKYVGDTEKNLARVFDAAESSSAVLFFDEADALFGARSEVRDAHDRYANIEVGYLLQRMEQYSGLAVLASNLQRNIDEAFLRRVRFVISFPFPDVASRRRIWEATWPPDAPSSELNWLELAARFDVTGATIRDAAVGAAFLAAADGRAPTMAHIEEAMSREYAKLGRLPVDPDQPVSLSSPTSTNRGAPA